MRTHQLIVAERKVTIVGRELIQGTVGEDLVTVELDDDWQGLDVTVTFEDNDGVKVMPGRNTDGSWTVPWEVLERTGSLYVIVEGRRNGLLLAHASAQTPFNVVASRSSAGSTRPHDPSVTDLQAARDGAVAAANSANAAAANAVSAANSAATDARSVANAAADLANSAASAATDAAADATLAAEEARGSISPDAKIYLTIEDGYLTLVDMTNTEEQ